MRGKGWMKENIYYYRAFGINIKSELMLRELKQIESNKDIDLSIVIGKIPEFIGKEKKEHQHDIEFPIRHYFYKKKAGEFYIEQGKRMVIEIEEDYEEDLLHAMLLEWGIGIALQQRESIVFHSGGVVYNNKAIIVCGDSGAGKSTLITELMKNQMFFLADDTIAISFKDGQVAAEPAFPQQKLCKDAAINFGYDITKLKLLNEDRKKYAVCRQKEFAHESEVVGGMFVIEKYHGRQVKIDAVKGREKLNLILRYLYTQTIYEHIGISPKLIKKCTEFAKYIPIYRIQRPVGQETIKEIAESIKEMIESDMIEEGYRKERA